MELPDPEVILAWIGGLLVAAEAIVSLTPTKKDDLLLGRIEKWLFRLIRLPNRGKDGNRHEP